METYLIDDVLNSTDRYKLFVHLCRSDNFEEAIQQIESTGIKVVNLGKELAIFLENLTNRLYLNIDTQDFIINLLDTFKSKPNSNSNSVIAIYNLGILFEPEIGLQPSQLLRDYSKSTALIILWENEAELPHKLFWPTQKNTYVFDFTDTALKELQYAV